MYSSGNRGVASFNTKPSSRTYSKESHVPEKSLRFSTGPIQAGKSLYSSPQIKSATSFNAYLPITNSVSAYGRDNEVKSSISSSFKSPVILKPSFRCTPTPNNTTVSQPPTNQNVDIKLRQARLIEIIRRCSREP